MPVLDIDCAGNSCWPYLRDNPRLITLIGPDAPPIGLALLVDGMGSGGASVVLLITLPDGRTVLTETSLALLEQAVGVFRASLLSRGDS